MISKIYLLFNLLTKRSNGFTVKTHSMGSIDREVFIARMVQINTVMTRIDIQAVLNVIIETIVDTLLQSYVVKPHKFYTIFSISEIFVNTIIVKPFKT